MNSSAHADRSGEDGKARQGGGQTGLLDLWPDALRATGAMRGQPPYRVTQVFEWVYRRGADGFAGMTNLPKGLRERLEQELAVYESSIADHVQSRDGTEKLLLRWPDEATSECVLIPEGNRRTACVSTQVGCPVRCVFCASGLGGLQRNLSAGQIVEQALRLSRLCGDERGLANVVFMGLGEPLANYEATVRAVRTLNADWSLNIGARRITISTVGLPKQMRRLADERLQVTLAVSLHAPSDELRRRLIPWAERITIDDLVSAGSYFFERTGREVTLEYVLLGGVNDGPIHARQLADVAKRLRSNVNLIRYNPVAGLPFSRPTSEGGRQFLSVLRKRGVNAHLRRSRGQDIDGACGQLRRREQSG
ncbi:MAG: 23S rRNA (adenine(2503)-C(2))-methyltransferase RlmN [Phycisphaerales bacterium]|nr:MAG: 23S rRNA (adenine(2503)-C(2))-methyltransferase RlmN [Phycisphaerales bacterium]